MFEKLSAHTKRWSIEIDEQTVFQSFKNRALQELGDYADSWSSDFWCDFPLVFNYLLGREAIDKASYLTMPEKFLNILRSSQNIKELAHYFQVSFIAIESFNSREDEYYKDMANLVSNHIFEAISTALTYTSQIGIEIAKSNDQVILYPRGAKLLDEATVNQNLSWLESHPSVLKHFEQALAQYMTGDKKQQRNLLDNLRFSLEQLLKDILGNDKSLENQKDKLLPWLEAQGVHKQTVNMYNALLCGPYTQFQNDAVKHGKREEGFTENDIEFMIYLTGTFMRLLLQLEQKALNPGN